jgi:hypothetical protein
MVRGESGKFGILGNVVSTSYGSHWAGQGSNPTLSATRLPRKNQRLLIVVQGGPLLCSELCSIRANSAALDPCGPALCA